MSALRLRGVFLSGQELVTVARLAATGLRAVEARDGITPRPEVRDLLATLSEAASVFAVEPPNVRGGVVAARSVVSPMTTAEAAVVLNVSEVHVRRIAGDLGGVQARAGGTWVFDRDAVVAFAAQRREAS